MDTCRIDCGPLGFAVAAADSTGVLSLQFVDESDGSTIAETDNVHLKLLAAELGEYLSGNLREFTVPLHPQGTGFQQKVWTSLQQIPFGKTMSYATQAESLGDPLAIRAMAAANGKNPIAVLIPCHRVIGSDGSLTGYAGGLWRKQWLLEHEGVLKRQEKLF